MTRLIILCEGLTEEKFVKEILCPYLADRGITVAAPILRTSLQGSGGVSKYQKIKNELKILCRDEGAIVTTMIDYYGIPKDTPGLGIDEDNIYKCAAAVEDAVNTDIGLNNCIFNVVMHEFEALLFSCPEAFDAVSLGSSAKILRVKRKFKSPEHINTSPVTAPSKCIKQLIPEYRKVSHGISISRDIGMDCMMKECRHFREWIDEIIQRCT
jgi:hypothetical protein